MYPLSIGVSTLNTVKRNYLRYLGTEAIQDARKSSRKYFLPVGYKI